MFFGKKLKELRLKKDYGLRKFAELLEVKPIVICDLECGYAEPPQEENWISDICIRLALDGDDELALTELYHQPFFMQKKPDFMPAFVTTVDGEPPKEKGLRPLCEAFKQDTDNHNKKADEFNKRRKIELEQKK